MEKNVSMQHNITQDYTNQVEAKWGQGRILYVIFPGAQEANTIRYHVLPAPEDHIHISWDIGYVGMKAQVGYRGLIYPSKLIDSR